jgi:hypothetical protein
VHVGGRRVGLIGPLLCSLLAGCSSMPAGLSLSHSAEPPIFGSLPAEKPLELGKRYYSKGEFGLAEQAFRKAVELDKNDPEAWLGLAASYDRLRRFDQARRAYDVTTYWKVITPKLVRRCSKRNGATRATSSFTTISTSLRQEVRCVSASHGDEVWRPG